MQRQQHLDFTYTYEDKQIVRSFCTQQAEAAQDLIMVLDSGRVTVIDRDGQLKRGDKASVSLKAQISVKMIELRLKILYLFTVHMIYL